MYQKKTVDLLLVRLSREEEKKKVINLLKSELGMTQEEAREEVENSPSILKENVDMEQGRILQDRMYPFVDLLPRYYNQGQDQRDSDEEEPREAEIETGQPLEDGMDAPVTHTVEEQEEDVEIKEEEFESVFEKNLDDSPPEDEIGEIEHDQSAYREEEIEKEDIEDDSFVITSAAEEFQSVERCHVCGRTPTGEEKLVPCRTCGEPTCATCYDRKKHVCTKCAAKGLDADRPLDSVPASREAVKTESRKAVRKPQKRKRKPVRDDQDTAGFLSRISSSVIVITGLVLVAIAFFLIDPLGLFTNPQPSGQNSSANPYDSSAAGDSVEVAVHDSTGAEPDSIPADSLLHEDSLQVSGDSTSIDSSSVSPGIALASIVIPDSLRSDSSYSVPESLTRTSLDGIEIYTDDLEPMGQILGELSNYHSLQLDAYTLVLTESGHDLLLMSILHPEPAERRASFIGSLATLLDSTMVDQMVLYYQENIYYEPVYFSFTADSFRVLARSSSPFSLQRKQQTFPETYDMVSGSIFEWMTDSN